MLPVLEDVAAARARLGRRAARVVIERREGGVLKLVLDAAGIGLRTQHLEDTLTRSLSRHLGCAVRLIIDEGGAEVPTPARQRTQGEQQRVRLAVEAFERDPAVSGLRERFDANVEDGSVKPSPGERA